MLTAGDFSLQRCTSWSERTCLGLTYYAGRDQCGTGSAFRKTLPMAGYEDVTQVKFKAHIWAVDTWDNEFAYVKLKDEAGNVIGETSIQSLWNHHV